MSSVNLERDIEASADVMFEAFKRSVMSQVEAHLRESIKPIVDAHIRDAVTAAGASLQGAIESYYDVANRELVVRLVTEIREAKP